MPPLTLLALPIPFVSSLWSPLITSLKVSLVAMAITLSTGIPIAYGMAYTQLQKPKKWQERWRGAIAIIDSLLLLPLVLPPTVVGFGLLWLLGEQGPLDGRLNLVFSWWAAVVTAVVVAFPLMYRSGRAAFRQIDAQLLQVARTLGASERGVFWQVALPLALPGLVAGGLLSLARSLGEFGATLMLAGNIPGKTQTLPMAVYFAVEGGDYETATQGSLLLGVVALVIVGLANKLEQDKTAKQTRWQQRRTSDARRWPDGQDYLLDVPAEAPSLASRWAEIQSEQLPKQWLPPAAKPACLIVDITKRLPRFTLRVQFKSEVALLGVLGASGAGKSLLLRCLAGIETPDSGRIVLGNQVLFDSDRKINLPSRDRSVALLFQNYALFPHMTALENVAFGLRHTDFRRSGTHKNDIALDELAAVGLAAHAHDYPHQLSGGQQQRVALARAIATQPKLLLLDEPFAALDRHVRSQLSQQLFQRLSTYQGTTLLISHNLQEIYRTEQVLALGAGRILQQDAPTPLFEKPASEAIARLIGPYNISPIQATNSAQPNGQFNGQFNDPSDTYYATNWQLSLYTASDCPNSLKSAFNVAIHPKFVQISLYSKQPSRAKSADRMVSQVTDTDAITERNSPTEEVSRSQTIGWPAKTWEHPEYTVVLIKLHNPPKYATDYHLTAFVSPSNWRTLIQQAPPWKIHLPPEHLIWLWS